MQDDKKIKETKHKKLLDRMKKQVISEEFDNMRLSYSFLDKTGVKGISKNTRIVFLFHKDKIGYVNELEKGQFIPFEKVELVPKNLKAFVKFSEITQFKEDKEQMTIQFKKGKQPEKWIFSGSKDLIKSWVKIIKANRKQYQEELNNPRQQVSIESKLQEIKQPLKVPNENEKQMSNNIENEKKNEPNALNKNDSQVDMRPPASSNPVVESKIEKNQNEMIAQSKLIEQGPNSNQEQIQNPYTEKDDGNNNPIPVFGSFDKKNEIERPKGTLFVGGIAVGNEKDQVQLKKRMESFESLALKAKQQYELKKKQSKKISQEVKAESEQFNVYNLLTFSTNTQYQIERMQRQWGYEFAKSQNEYEIVDKFKFYVEAVSRRIVDELGLEEKKRYYQPQEISEQSLKYDINGVLFEVFLIGLREKGAGYGDKGIIPSNSSEKMAAHQFKNYDYILRLTANKGKIRVPLSMMTHYKGFGIFAKVLIPSAQRYDNMDLLEKQMQILEAESRINNSIFQDNDSGRIVALESKAYEKLARAESSNKKFDFCYVEDLKYYLPHDFYAFNTEKPYERLRWQLIQDDQCEDKLLNGEDMCAISARLKLPQELRDGINQLTELSKSIPNRIDNLVFLLESAEQYFTNSEQLSEIMHKSGINMRYLGILLQKLNANWLKEIVMSEIVARCAKKHLSNDLQNTKNLDQTNVDQVIKFHERQLVKFLNKMMGNNQQTQTFWKNLNMQSQYQYKVSLHREEINPEYLLQALQHHCCFKFKDLRPNDDEDEKDKRLKKGALLKSANKIGMGNISNPVGKTSKYNVELFASASTFNINQIASFEHRSKVYNLQFTQFYTSIKTLISELTPQSYEQLDILLNLSRIELLPDHFKLSSMHDQIVSYLINWVSPKQMRAIYYPNQIQIGEVLPSRLLYSLRLAQIRWMLKQGDVAASQEVKDWVVEHINKWIGQCHPILTELYEIYANYYMMHKDEQKKAVNYCKSAIMNQQKLVGQNHQKMADNYYLLGTVYLNYGKQRQAITSFKKAKQIIFKNKSTDSEAYGQVCLKMGQLYLSLNYLEDAIQSSLQAMNILQKSENTQSFIAAIELVCRCYEVDEDWQSYMKLIETVLVNKVVLFVEDLELTERIVKVCILPSLKVIGENNSNIANKIIKIISQLPDTTRAPNMAYNFLRIRIEDKSFPHRFLQALSNIEETLEEIETNGMLARWKGFQNLTNKALLNKVGINMQNKGFNFIATLEALNIFIGSSFIEGVLLDE